MVPDTHELSEVDAILELNCFMKYECSKALEQNKANVENSKFLILQRRGWVNFTHIILCFSNYFGNVNGKRLKPWKNIGQNQNNLEQLSKFCQYIKKSACYLLDESMYSGTDPVDICRSTLKRNNNALLVLI